MKETQSVAKRQEKYENEVSVRRILTRKGYMNICPGRIRSLEAAAIDRNRNESRSGNWHCTDDRSQIPLL